MNNLSIIRKRDLVELAPNIGFIVSTILRSKYPIYETAIIFKNENQENNIKKFFVNLLIGYYPDAHKIEVVEVYNSTEEALTGHIKWLILIKNMNLLWVAIKDKLRENSIGVEEEEIDFISMRKMEPFLGARKLFESLNLSETIR